MNIKESLEEFYNNLLGVESPWEVEGIRRDSKRREVTVLVVYSKEEPYACPICGKRGKLHDNRKRQKFYKFSILSDMYFGIGMELFELLRPSHLTGNLLYIITFLRWGSSKQDILPIYIVK